MKYRFVDRIISLEPGQMIQGQYAWPEDVDIFQDHFPGFAVVPGVLITEMMGQTAALCLESARDEPVAPILMQIKNATFRDWIRPGVCLDIHAEIMSNQKKIARAKTWTRIDGSTVAKAELLFAFELKSKLGLPVVDPVLKHYQDQGVN